jgi:hypothetical protein
MIVKIGFTVPNGIAVEDTIAWKSFQKITKQGTTGDIQLSYTTASGCCIGINRNLCVNEGRSLAKIQKEFNFDFMLYVDFDIEFTFRDILRIVSHNKPIMSGSYRRKEDPRIIHAGYWKDSIVGLADFGFSSEEKGIKSVDWLGGGFLLISKEVFCKMEYPYFRYLVIEYMKNGELCAEDTTEDFGFCINAVKAGFELLVDCDCVVKHHNHVRGITDADTPTAFMIKLSEQELKYLSQLLQAAMLKGNEVPLWVNVHNAIQNARTSIS